MLEQGSVVSWYSFLFRLHPLYTEDTPAATTLMTFDTDNSQMQSMNTNLVRIVNIIRLISIC